ncbi:hypothetical protein NI17_013685 [Thermobifida halotolerans]|uniref:Uncharacterized protein n=1 Tax=Thermobifida halotolerans TaxID=483545 RepID=A0AA97M218_9ACTN|nr:hypothetical protein [Thermobifida halotolerans]UOE17918.1 hypothetical protein NI17_013685 [Thermobifida halotolerans]
MSEPDEERLVVFDDDLEILPDTTSDEYGPGWGEATDRDGTSRIEELLNDVPPHWA